MLNFHRPNEAIKHMEGNANGRRIKHPVPQSSLLLSPGGKTQECEVSTVGQKFQTKKKNFV